MAFFQTFLANKHKIFYKNIVNNYDKCCPQPVFNDHNEIIGYGCVICDKFPDFCPYFDKNTDCTCNCCDIFTPYLPKTIYNSRKILETHIFTHNLILDKNLKLFI